MINNSLFRFIVAYLIIFLTSLVSASEPVTLPVSVSLTGEMGNRVSGEPFYPTSISSDGRFIAFSSEATDLINVDTNQTTDVFIHDRENSLTEIVSVNNLQKQGNKFSFVPSISADGRYVTYISWASNLIENDTNDDLDVLIFNRESGTTDLVSMNSLGIQGTSVEFFSRPVISANGRYIVFESRATNLVFDDYNSIRDVFIHDRASGTTGLVSINSLGEQANDRNSYSSISANGRYIVFDSYATNLIDSDSNLSPDVFIHDRKNGTTELVSTNSWGEQGNYISFLGSISADGRYISFSSAATNLVNNDTNDFADVFVHDRISGITELVSMNSLGEQGNNHSSYSSISANGRFITFVSRASNLVENDTNFTEDIFLHDRIKGITSRISINQFEEEANSKSWAPVISDDGNYIVFTSHATNLVSNEDYNYGYDVFIRGPFLSFDAITSYHTSFESTSWPERWYSYGWSQDDSTRSEGTYSLKANPTADNETAVTEWRVNIANAGTMFFDLKVNSEQDRDFFRLYIDDELKLERSGFIDWREYHYILSPGEHRLRFEYQKDSNNQSGADTAWIDNVRFTSGLLIDSYHDIQKTLIDRLQAKMPYEHFDNVTASYQKKDPYFSSPMEIVLGFIFSDAFQRQELNDLTDGDIDELVDLLFLIYVGSAGGPTELEYWSIQRLICEFDMQEFLQSQAFPEQ